MEDKIYTILLALVVCIVINNMFQARCVVVNGPNPNKIQEIIYSK